MSAPKVVVPPPFTAIQGLHESLKAAGFEVAIAGSMERPWTPEQLIEVVADADAVIASPGQPFPAEVLKAAPKLRMVSSPVVGVDHIDVDVATELGIVVANCPTDEIIIGMAEATVMFMVALLLQLERKQATMRAGNWRPPTTSTLLRRKTVGLIGYGRIARAVEQRLQGWEVTIQAYDPFVPNTVSLDTLLITSDVISIHTPRTKDTRGLIGTRELVMMKPTAILINTSRGGVIDEAALAEAINSGQIAGAALDVFEQEPINMDNPLFRSDPNRVILTPHNIGHNVESGPAGAELAFENIARVLEGELPRNVENREVIPRWQERFGLGAEGILYSGGGV
jgi:D-3-phosphoglycerate dehydrogenase / 2-oxoglutarate reductase